MIRLPIATAFLLLCVTLAATGCEQFNARQAPQAGSLTRHLMMMDADGKNYGAVELDPINGGKVYDAQGRLIGRIMQVGPDTLAPTAQ